MKPDWPALLPAGMHGMDLAALEALVLAGPCNTNERVELYARLQVFLTQIETTGASGEAWIDGSFLTRKPNPSDIDVALFFDEGGLARVDEASGLLLDTLMDRPTARERYGLDVFAEISGDFHRAAYWRGIFGFCHDCTTAKGIAVLQFNR